MLVLARFPNEGVYIGRDVRVTVTDYEAGGIVLSIEHDPSTVVSGPDVSARDHLSAQIAAESTRTVDPPFVRLKNVRALAGEVVSIGRGISITVVSVVRDGEVQLGVDAPQHIAVSRDDFTREEHLKFQRRRESRAGIR